MMRLGYWIKAGAFTLGLTVPLMCPLGVWLGMYWLCPILFFVILPLLGRMLGGDPTSYYPPIEPLRSLRAYFAVLPYLYFPLWFIALCWTAQVISSPVVSVLDGVGAVFSLGIAGAVSTCVAHEIMHRTGRGDQSYARLMIAFCGYGHLMIEHSVHHANVGDLVCGSTPRAGENVYRFVWRVALQGYRNAQGVEARRLSRTGRASWHNAIYQNYAISLLFLMGCLALWGWASAGVFLFQAVFTIFSVQAITFIQHYGLVRKAGEAIAAHHSWADNCVIANALTFNNNHHSQHHLEPRTPYFHLRTHPEAPRLPASYMVMFVVAMVPVWWRAVMDKRLVKHQEFIGRHAEQLARRQSHRLIG